MYSAEEIGDFFKEVQRQYAQEMLDSLGVQRHAHHADKKGMQTFVSQLEKLAKKSGGYMTPMEFVEAFARGSAREGS